ncbi:MAG: AbrB/MazE/SpoVT family DNA-binding domain-containing protein [Thermoanaerobaculia bacterium]|jgi:AbrB family looped-hinge helix DNA binding protein|nr:MAG: AbrB/MazE/SpoVT family DNA-binding domain-containing protein [Thermoanaerobaculia bacterium]MBZ0102179.1 AbrB/MazE/SpoVT family DNA-binding domain-containing protein [Thermoanaerobaculia bacterium]
MSETVTRLGEGGRVVIPAAFRKAIGIQEGDPVILILREGEIAMLTAKQAVERAQAIVRKYVPKGKSLSAELIAERRREAKRG